MGVEISLHPSFFLCFSLQEHFHHGELPPVGSMVSLFLLSFFLSTSVLKSSDDMSGRRGGGGGEEVTRAGYAFEQEKRGE